MLEYYNGMLFVTTNRLDDFDEAFHNRVHVSINYEPLDQPSRVNIWRQHVGKIAKETCTAHLWTDGVYQTLGSLETNGRDIRNFSRTAVGYARAAKEDFTVKHLLTVARNNFTRDKLESLANVMAELEKVAELMEVEVERVAKVKKEKKNREAEEKTTEKNTGSENGGGSSMKVEAETETSPDSEVLLS
jgi:hypothetical protein